MVEIVRYNSDRKYEWDSFIEKSKNGTFLFFRDYMDYHSDKFKDHSLLFYQGNKIIGLIPSNQNGQEIQSHGGLTYGGLIGNEKLRTKIVLEIFKTMLTYFKNCGIHTITYKTIPSIYHRTPSGEDLYALFRNKANLYRRDVSSVVDMSNKIKFSTNRKRGIKKSLKTGLIIKNDNNYESLIGALNDLLENKYKTQAGHTVKEIQFLANNFPNNIMQFSVYDNDEFLAGTLIYVTDTVAHAQYIFSNQKGQDLCALDLLFDYLINEKFMNKVKYFDFGISTENDGQYLNEGLIYQKEGFGARAVTYDSYKLTV